MSSEGVYGIAVSGRSTGPACCFTSGFDWAKSAEVKRAAARNFLMAAKSIASESDEAATERIGGRRRRCTSLERAASLCFYLVATVSIGGSVTSRDGRA